PSELPVQAPVKFELVINHNPYVAYCRRRGTDRITMLFAALQESGYSTKRRTAASHQFGRYRRHSGHAAKSSGASIRRFCRVGPGNFTPSPSQIRTLHSRVIRLV